MGHDKVAGFVVLIYSVIHSLFVNDDYLIM